MLMQVPVRPEDLLVQAQEQMEQMKKLVMIRSVHGTVNKLQGLMDTFIQTVSSAHQQVKYNSNTKVHSFGIPSSSGGTEWEILKIQQIMTFWKNVLSLAFTLG